MKIVFLVSAVFIIFSLALIAASQLQTLLKTDFDEGTYNDTYYNTTNSAVQLNLTYSSGNYTSEVFDLGYSSYENLTWHEQRIQCPENMTYINKLNGFCIDKYEASVIGCDTIGINCASASSGYCSACSGYSGVFGGTDSYTGTTVVASSRPDVAPFVMISAKQAFQMCANAGKHLCTSEEWMAAANINGTVYNLPADLSANPNNCNTNSACQLNASTASNRACLTMNRTGCVSSEGVYDMVGNVWEWVNETVDVINPLGNAIAGTGTANYYYPNSTQQWATTRGTATAIYGNDGVYFPTTTTGRAVIRGGAWDIGANAGPFCADLSHAPSTTNPGIGFRCCSS